MSNYQDEKKKLQQMDKEKLESMKKLYEQRATPRALNSPTDEPDVEPKWKAPVNQYCWVVTDESSCVTAARVMMPSGRFQWSVQIFDLDGKGKSKMREQEFCETKDVVEVAAKMRGIMFKRYNMKKTRQIKRMPT